MNKQPVDPTATHIAQTSLLKTDILNPLLEVNAPDNTHNTQKQSSNQAQNKAQINDDSVQHKADSEEEDSGQKDQSQNQQSEHQIKQQEEIKKIRRLVDDDDEQSVESQDDCEIKQKIKRIIVLLVKHVDRSDYSLQKEKQKCVGDDRDLAEVFEMLIRKFKKLKKTKEEMTKYCMRKAFKFLACKHKKIFDGKDSTDFLKEYFEHMESESFSVPFKKNSEEKTMNTNFLKKLFSSTQFTSDYKLFLKIFVGIVEDDNNKKIKYLTSTVKHYLQGGSLKKLENVKRLPWTQAILDKTIELANRLLSHSPLTNGSEEVPIKPVKRHQSIPRPQRVVVVEQQVQKKKTVGIYPHISLNPPKCLLKAFVKYD